MLQHQLKNRIHIVKQFGDLPEIECFPNQLNQVFMNILVNASQAIQDRGEIRVRTWKEDDTVKIAISDTGDGIPPEHLLKIFDPGFTTKDVGVGTGLGLSICYNIVREHHGTIQAESSSREQRSPSIFQSKLRMQAQMNEKLSPTILLVDDEEMVLSSIKSFFAIETDYRLLTYTSPEKALAELDVDGNRVDLVISDYLMPEMDGITFLAKVREKLPLVPRILLTGYADKENAIKAINNVGLYQYIEKPWDNEDLKLIIRNGLEKTILLKQLETKIREVERAPERTERGSEGHPARVCVRAPPKNCSCCRPRRARSRRQVPGRRKSEASESSSSFL